MKFSESNVYRARAAHCSHQSNLTDDARLKKYWDDLADDWLALADVVLDEDQYRKVIH
jgi:hypothetical protein